MSFIFSAEGTIGLVSGLVSNPGNVEIILTCSLSTDSLVDAAIEASIVSWWNRS